MSGYEIVEFFIECRHCRTRLVILADELSVNPVESDRDGVDVCREPGRRSAELWNENGSDSSHDRNVIANPLKFKISFPSFSVCMCGCSSDRSV